MDVRLKVELSLISGKCVCGCKTDTNYLGALEQAIKLLTDYGNIEQFRQELMGIK